MKAGTEER